MKGKQNSPFKKSVRRKDTEPEIKIIKHFQPDFRNHSSHQNCNLPEVDCDVDEREVQWSKKTSRVPSPSKNNVIANKIEIKLQKLRSKSLIETTNRASSSKFSFSSTSSNLLQSKNSNRNQNVIANQIEQRLDKFKTKKYGDDSSSKFSLTSNTTLDSRVKIKPLGTNRNNLIFNASENIKLNEVFGRNVKKSTTANEKVVKKYKNVQPKPKTEENSRLTATRKLATNDRKSIKDVKVRSNNRSGKDLGTNYSVSSSSDYEGIRSVSFRSKKPKSYSEGHIAKDKRGSSQDRPPVDQYIGENYVQSLKKEIQLSKTVTANSPMGGDIGTETIDRLREEILKFIETNVLEKKQCITELKAEIAEFRNRGAIQVYQVSDVTKDEDQDGASQRESTDCACYVFSPNVNIEVTVPPASSSGSSLEPAGDESLDGKGIEEIRLRLGTPKAKQSPERLNAEQIDIGGCCPDVIASTSTDDIATKIIHANLLINRVKETLDEIKAKSTSATPKDVFAFDNSKSNSATDSDKENLERPIEVKRKIRVRPTKICDDDDDDDIQATEDVAEVTPDKAPRPETRRGMRSAIPVDIQDKFRTTPKDSNTIQDMDDVDMEILHAKLDAISERTDSDESEFAVPAPPVPSLITQPQAKVTTTTACNTEDATIDGAPTTEISCNTESIITQIRQTQTVPTTITATTDISCNTESITTQMRQIQTVPTKTKVSETQSVFETDVKSTQTEKNTLSNNNSNSTEITATTERGNRLHVQLMAPINIRSSLVSQMTLHFSINMFGETNVHQKNISANNSFIETKSPTMTDNKIKLDIHVANNATKTYGPNLPDFHGNIMDSSEKSHVRADKKDFISNKGETREAIHLSGSNEIINIDSVSESYELNYEIEIPVNMRAIDKKLVKPKAKLSEPISEPTKTKYAATSDKPEQDIDILHKPRAFDKRIDKPKTKLTESIDNLSETTDIVGSDMPEPQVNTLLKPRAYDISDETVTFKTSKDYPDGEQQPRKEQISPGRSENIEGIVKKAVSKLEKDVLKNKNTSPPKLYRNDIQLPAQDGSRKTPEITVPKWYEQSIGIQTNPELLENKTIQVETPKPEVKDIMLSASSSTCAPSVDLTSVDQFGQIKSPESKRKKRRKLEGSESSDKELVLKSYHIYDNVNDHDPGVLTTSSYDIVGVIDEDVYKTYINPQGYIPPPKYALDKVSSSNFDPSRKMLKLEKLASSKILDRVSIDRSQTQTSTKTESKKGISDHALEYKKLWDIGLYATKSTQVTQAAGSSKQPSSSDPLQSYETLSFTISYSTDESTSPDSSLNVISQVGSDHYKSQLFNAEKNFRKSLPHLGEVEHNVLKSLREKLSKNVPQSEEEENGLEDIESIMAHDRSLSEFIVGLTGLEKIKRVSKSIRKSLQSKPGSKHKDKDFDVLPVQINANFEPRDRDFCNPLAQGENGRYKDEENLFREIQHIKHKRKRLESFMKPKNKHFLQKPANSDTLSTEKSVSEGEVKCPCSISLGEVHRCKPPNRPRRNSPRRSFELNGFKTVRQRRTYFNNWITYYVNDNSSSINDTSISTSNT